MAAAAVVLPRRPDLLLDHFTEPRGDGLSAERHLARSLQESAEWNEAKLHHFYLAIRLALLTLGVQALLWSLQLSANA